MQPSLALPGSFLRDTPTEAADVNLLTSSNSIAMVQITQYSSPCADRLMIIYCLRYQLTQVRDKEPAEIWPAKAMGSGQHVHHGGETIPVIGQFTTCAAIAV